MQRMASQCAKALRTWVSGSVSQAHETSTAGSGSATVKAPCPCRHQHRSMRCCNAGIWRPPTRWANFAACCLHAVCCSSASQTDMWGSQPPGSTSASCALSMHWLMILSLQRGLMAVMGVQMTVRDALNSALDEEMARDDKVFLMGEEVRRQC